MKLNSKKITHLFYAFIILLNLTEAFRIFAFVFSVNTVLISTSTLIINTFYIIYNYRVLKNLISLGLFRLWLFIILILPILAMVVSLSLGFMNFSEFIYFLAFNSLFGSLFIGTTILSRYATKKWISRIIWISIFTTIFGFILNYTFLELFTVLGNASNTDKSWANYGTEITRGMSFYLAPNRAGFTCICFLIVLLETGVVPKKLKYYLFSIVTVVAMVFVTGSRTSLFILLLILFIYFAPILFSVFRKRYKFRKEDAKLMMIISSILGVFLFLFVVNIVATELTAKGNPLGERLNIFHQLSTTLSGKSSFEDDSYDSRVESLDLYFDEIGSNLFFGIGPAMIRKKLENGEFDHVSQNQYVEGTLEYGIFYTFFFCYVLIKTYKDSKKGAYKNYYFNPLLVFIVFLFFLGFSINDFFWNRPIVVILGILLGQYYKDNYQYNYEQKLIGESTINKI